MATQRSKLYAGLKARQHCFDAKEIIHQFSLVSKDRVGAMADRLAAYISTNLPAAFEKRDALGDYRANPYVLMTTASGFFSKRVVACSCASEHKAVSCKMLRTTHARGNSGTVAIGVHTLDKGSRLWRRTGPRGSKELLRSPYSLGGPPRCLNTQAARFTGNSPWLGAEGGQNVTTDSEKNPQV
jgi:hypothetical protein